MEEKKILVIDDDSLMREFLAETLQRMEYKVSAVGDGKAGIEQCKECDFNLVITDIRMPGISGMDVLKHIKAVHPDIPVIMMTAFGTIDNAVEAMKMGAFDYLTKPFSADSVEMTVKKVFKYIELEEENRRLRSELNGIYGFDQIVGKSTKMRKVFDILQSVIKSNATVFIQGPSGTGKELVARAIHYNSPRAGKPFIKTNCAALPEGLMESELFGHEKGAFTGAIRQRKGRFEAADGGTLLLDEVSEMSSSLQAKLLRVLQEKEFERVGDHLSISVDVRIIATTNRDIKEEVRKGNFREDLYYRLNVIPIILPTLKERIGDIPLLVNHFIEKYNQEYYKNIKGVTDDALNFLIQMDWPGNVRELENRVERAIILSQGALLEPKHFIFEDDDFKLFKPFTSEEVTMTLYEMEKQMIFRTLRANENNRTKTAEQLGISVRTLRNKLNEYKQKNEIDPALLNSL